MQLPRQTDLPKIPELTVATGLPIAAPYPGLFIELPARRMAEADRLQLPVPVAQPGAGGVQLPSRDTGRGMPKGDRWRVIPNWRPVGPADVPYVFPTGFIKKDAQGNVVATYQLPGDVNTELLARQTVVLRKPANPLRRGAIAEQTGYESTMVRLTGTIVNPNDGYPWEELQRFSRFFYTPGQVELVNAKANLWGVVHVVFGAVELPDGPESPEHCQDYMIECLEETAPKFFLT